MAFEEGSPVCSVEICRGPALHTRGDLKKKKKKRVNPVVFFCVVVGTTGMGRPWGVLFMSSTLNRIECFPSLAFSVVCRLVRLERLPAFLPPKESQRDAAVVDSRSVSTCFFFIKGWLDGGSCFFLGLFCFFAIEMCRGRVFAQFLPPLVDGGCTQPS